MSLPAVRIFLMPPDPAEGMRCCQALRSFISPAISASTSCTRFPELPEAGFAEGGVFSRGVVAVDFFGLDGLGFELMLVDAGAW